MKNIIKTCLMLILVSTGFATEFSVQGVLRDPLGRTVDNGSYSVIFKIYDEVSGSASALWTETHGSVDVQHGIFSVLLGSIEDMDALSFKTKYWIGISVAGGVEMTPRTQLTTSPYSKAVLGTDNIFPSVGRVGVGTTDPQAAFHVKNKNNETDIFLIKDADGGEQVKVANDGTLSVPDGIFGNGVLGVGTQAPDARFHIVGANGDNLLITDATGTEQVKVASDGTLTVPDGIFGNGVLGVGTQNPTAALHILSNDDDDKLRIDDGNGDPQVQVNSDGYLGINNPTLDGVGVIGAPLSVSGNLRLYNDGVLLFTDGTQLASANFGGSATGVTSPSSATINALSSDGTIALNIGSADKVIVTSTLTDIRTPLQVKGSSKILTGSLVGGINFRGSDAWSVIDGYNDNDLYIGTSANYVDYGYFEDLNSNSTLNVTGATTLSSLAVGGTTTLSGALIANGATTLSSLAVTGSGSLSSLMLSGNLKRSDHAVGFLEGSYSNLGNNGIYTNPIYTIGSSYNPTNTSLQQMYGIGYTNLGSFTDQWAGTGAISGWGMYVANGGAIKIALDGDNGIGYASGSFRAPIFYDQDDTGYYINPNGTSKFNYMKADIYYDNPYTTVYMNLNGTSVWSPSNASGATDDIVMDASGGEQTWRPGSGNMGYIGTAPNYWWKAYLSQVYRNNEYVLSDRNLKENIRDLDSEDVLSKLMNLRGVMYDAKEGTILFDEKNLPSNENIMGVIAQEVTAEFPEVAGQDWGENKTVQYDRFVPIFIESIQQIKNEKDLEIADLKKEYDAKISALLERVEALENQ